MQFMKNANIKRFTQELLIDVHKDALGSFSCRREDYTQEALIDWLKIIHENLKIGYPLDVDEKSENEIILEYVTEIITFLVVKKSKIDPPRTVKEYKIIDDQIIKKINLFHNFKDYLDKKIRTYYN